MANNKFSDFFSAPSIRAEAEKRAKELINGLKAEEKDELNQILGDRDKINAVLSSPAARKIMEKLNGKKDEH